MSVEQIRASYSPEVREALAFFKAKIEASKEALTPEQQEAEKEAHRLLRGMLWAMFPRDETLKCAAEDDEESGAIAWRLIDGLRVAGIGLIKI